MVAEQFTLMDAVSAFTGSLSEVTFQSRHQGRFSPLAAGGHTFNVRSGV